MDIVQTDVINGGGSEWYIIEYESSAYPPLEAVERCLRALRAMGK